MGELSRQPGLDLRSKRILVTGGGGFLGRHILNQLVSEGCRSVTAPRRREFDLTDATMEPDPGPPPEAVFDRLTGPFDRRRAIAMPGAADEET